MAKWTEEKKDRLLGYLRDDMEREDRQRSQVIPGGTEKDFRDLLDAACTTTVGPAASPAEKLSGAKPLENPKRG